MSKTYVNDGKTIRYTPSGSAVTAGQVVVVGALLGVAPAAIADGEEGVLNIDGVFELPAVTGAAFAAGRPITWDVSANSGAGLADDHSATPASGDLTGGCIAMETIASAPAGSTVKVRLNVGPNTIN